MKRSTRAHLNRYVGRWVSLSPSECEDVMRSAARQAAELRRLRAAIHKVLRILDSDLPDDDDYNPYIDLRAALKPRGKR